MTVETYSGTLIAPTAGALPVRQEVTGLLFPPKAVIFYSACTAVLDSSQSSILSSFGVAVQGSQFVVANGSDGTGTASNAGRISRFGTECICLPLNGTPAIDALARCVSLNGDGFSIDWTDLAATAGLLVHYLAIGGSDITNATVVEVTPSTTTNGATQAVTVGFPSDFILTVSPAVPSSTGIVDANICIGAARRDPTTQQYAAYWFENDAAANMDCSVYAASNRAGALPSSTSIKDADYSISSWDPAGVTFSWDDAPTALTPRLYVLALRGGAYQIDGLSSPASTGTQTVATGFPPKGMLFFGSSDAADNDNAASATVVDAQFSIGACDSGLRQGGNVFVQQDANASSFAKRRTSTAKVITRVTGTAATVQAEAGVSAVSGTGYTLNWTTASATAHKMAAVCFGDQQPAPPFVFTNIPAPR